MRQEGDRRVGGPGPRGAAARERGRPDAARRPFAPDVRGDPFDYRADMEIRLERPAGHPHAPLTFDVVVDGPPTGQPVLLLHGFPQTARSWDQVVPALAAAGLRVIAPNQRGYSPGARPADPAAYATPHLVEDALGVLDALGVADAHVVGHDWGAMVGWRLAAWRPERVRSLTALCVPHPSAFAWARENDPDQARRSSYMDLFRQEGRAEQTLLADDARRLRAVFRPLPAGRAEPHVLAMTEPGALTAALNWYRAARLDARPGEDVTVPTTYVWSTADPAFGPVGARRCAEHVTGPYRYVELEGVSHWIPDEEPDAVVEAVLAHARG
ncbi:Pimeloyl-ACP methyl ester carboxylesterase [Streptoalloteichus tenebrarius]|uniref:Pimeloyl-ACP methyl ester carboxylesterase n=2 Tax=Streptoalloteichus tenebrarius (strain ATCC 17920 / DSM 40477 / JCM 4838 / CBS 697.72 / NBRC 16177 / NCIMB 11028 / NRRL B-12390 / A12253. 1 / ISP 5477) TaxID=1933 RepID=A0ABT1HSY5_STRSD|nr:Pimeloyl-ACP methyl ester carboxylesterase [Streptoalloteichus tenebrarius]